MMVDFYYRDHLLKMLFVLHRAKLSFLAKWQSLALFPYWGTELSSVVAPRGVEPLLTA